MYHCRMRIEMRDMNKNSIQTEYEIESGNPILLVLDLTHGSVWFQNGF